MTFLGKGLIWGCDLGIGVRERVLLVGHQQEGCGDYFLCGGKGMLGVVI